MTEASSQDSWGLELSKLLESVDRLGELSGEAAREENDRIFGSLQRVHQEADFALDSAKKELEATRSEYERVVERRVATQKEIDALGQEIERTEVDFASLEARLHATRSDLEAEKRRLADLRRRKSELEARRLELARFFWVPGYGCYLLVRTIDDAISQIPTVEARIGQAQAKCNELAKLLERTTRELAERRSRREQLESSLGRENDRVLALTEDETHISRDLAVLEVMKRTLSEFSDVESSAEQRCRSVGRFSQLLRANETLQGDGGSLLIGLREALQHMSDLLDRYRRGISVAGLWTDERQRIVGIQATNGCAVVVSADGTPVGQGRFEPKSQRLSLDVGGETLCGVLKDGQLVWEGDKSPWRRSLVGTVPR